MGLYATILVICNGIALGNAITIEITLLVNVYLNQHMIFYDIVCFFVLVNIRF